MTRRTLCPREGSCRIPLPDPHPSVLSDNPRSKGGVILVGGEGKIEIDNTFEARLRLLGDTALPAVRETLFGKNPNRKFTD